MDLITNKQYIAAASLLKCEVAVIRAVAEVESTGGGFMLDGRVKILFEPHIFWEQLSKVGKLNKTLRAIAKDPESKKYERVLYKSQGTFPYGTYNQQWSKLELACKFDIEAAHKACSWGRFQALGKYHKECGFDHIEDMVARFELNEGEHLVAFVKMIKYRRLDTALRNKDWDTFALRYNGKEYKRMKYDIKLAAAYKKYSLSLQK